ILRVCCVFACNVMDLRVRGDDVLSAMLTFEQPCLPASKSLGRQAEKYGVPRLHGDQSPFECNRQHLIRQNA
ncbi:MAG: hypothetical protein KIH69_012245, partial [Anaerolineae bacterium]|nr:hypothetical protein [Anaerolineae bacterium]